MTILTAADIAAAERLIGGSARSAVRAVAAEVSAITGVPVDTIMGRKRTARVSGSRAIVMAASQRIGVTAGELATVFDRDVSTIKHILAVEKARRAEKTNPPE